jgi:hypothetical protein
MQAECSRMKCDRLDNDVPSTLSFDSMMVKRNLAGAPVQSSSNWITTQFWVLLLCRTYMWITWVPGAPADYVPTSSPSLWCR